MEISAPKQTVNKIPQEVYDFLSDLSNIKKLMPEDLEVFEMTGDDSFFFVLKGMPKIYLKRGDSIPPSKIVLESAREGFDFHIDVQIVAMGDSQSEVSLDFLGKFNAMMAMMIKSPITNFINTLAENLQKIA